MRKLKKYKPTRFMAKTSHYDKRLNELYAANGQVGFLASQRVDGKMILPEAVKVLVQKAS